MKYKVIKEFDSLKKGDVLTNSEENPEIFYFEEDTENKYIYISYNDEIINELEDKGYLQLVEEDDDCEECTCVVCKAIDEIDRMLKQYEEDNEKVTEKFSNNEIPYCAKLEADTVHTNLKKALEHIKEILMDE